jgi:uncharacterized protein involved in type VI secretion and phage assembly
MTEPTEDETRTAGVRTAIVRDNDDPEGLGRVQVGYPWTDGEETHWARIATEMTGRNYGTYFLPEEGEEVLVAFEAGDRRRPYVVGSLWSRDRTPPVTDVGDNDVRTITTRSGHRVSFDDDADGSVTVETTGGHRIVLDDGDGEGSGAVTIEDAGGNSVEMDASDGEVAIMATDTISLDADTIDLSAREAVTVDSEGSVDVSGAGTVTVDSDGQLTLESAGLGVLSAAGPLQLRGAIIQLN